MGSCGVWLGNICLNAVRAIATIFSCSKSCVCPCEFCFGGQSQIWRDAAKLSTSIFFLSEGRHHSSSVGNAMLLTSSDKDTWCSLGCRVAMFQGEHWDVFEGYHGRLLPPPERAWSWLLESWILRLWRVTSWVLWNTGDWKCILVWYYLFFFNGAGTVTRQNSLYKETSCDPS